MADKILVLNSGSTSLKYKIFNLDSLEMISENNFQNVENLSEVLKQILREIGNIDEIIAVGHRVVHGGLEFLKPTKVTKENIDEIAKYNHLAPLHNPSNLKGIETCLEYLPSVDNYAVFDTAFYEDLPDESRFYPIPQELAKEDGLVRFGFHGISHKFMMNSVAKKLKKDVKKIKIISCHLGGGASITAIKNGKPVDTSMGLTPLEGLMMMTRCGDVDPGIVLKMVKKYGIEEVDNILNTKSGIYGISGITNYLELLKNRNFGDPNARLAFKMFVYRIRKYIGAYCALLDGCDAIVFTGMIGAGRPETRNEVMKEMTYLKKIKVLAIHTDEEFQIASDIKDTLSSYKK